MVWILARLLERVSLRTFASLVEELLRLSMGIDELSFQVGIDKALLEPANMHKLAVITSGKSGKESDNEASEDIGIASFSPSLFNHPSFRTACIPAANWHFTARALIGTLLLKVNQHGLF
jgi:hypothetical protein